MRSGRQRSGRPSSSGAFWRELLIRLPSFLASSSCILVSRPDSLATPPDLPASASLSSPCPSFTHRRIASATPGLTFVNSLTYSTVCLYTLRSAPPTPQRTYYQAAAAHPSPAEKSRGASAPRRSSEPRRLRTPRTGAWSRPRPGSAVSLRGKGDVRPGDGARADVRQGLWRHLAAERLAWCLPWRRGREGGGKVEGSKEGEEVKAADERAKGVV